MPETVSPLRSVAPCGGAEPIRIAATSRNSIGVPFFASQDDIAEIFGRGGAAGADKSVLFESVFDIAAAEICIVGLDARRDVVKGQAVLIEKRGVHHNLELLRLPAPRVDFADARNGAQLRLDHPFVQILQIHRAHGAGERVLVEFPESGSGKPEERLNAGG